VSTDEVKAFAGRLHEGFQATAADFFIPGDESDEETPETGVLTEWFLVCGWTGSDGGRWVTYHRCPGQPQWTSRGLLLEAVGDL
jgi:hypothetical protein